MDSCFSRFIAMSACSFAQSINSDKSVKESLDIADDLFYLLASGYGLDINDIFDEKIWLNKISELKRLNE